MLKESIQRTRFIFRALTRRKLDLLDQIEADHLRIEFLFLQWRFANNKARREEILGSIQRELLLLFQLEKSVLYSVCERIPELKKFVSDAQELHNRARTSFKEHKVPGKGKGQGEERNAEKVRALISEVRTHFSDEENDFFDQVRDLLKPALLYKLGREYRTEKQDAQRAAA